MCSGWGAGGGMEPSRESFKGTQSLGCRGVAVFLSSSGGVDRGSSEVLVRSSGAVVRFQ